VIPPTLITGGAVVTVDDEGRVLDPGWVLVDNDLIADTGTGEPPAEARRSAELVLDASGSAVMPGMVNGHTHLFQTLFRGLADDKPLLEWLRDCIWPGATELDAEAAHAAATLGMIENLRGGATSIVDHQYIHGAPGIDDAVCRAAAEVGVRFVLASGWADRNYHPPLTESADTVIDRIRPVRETWHGAMDGRISVGLAPLIPWGCSDEAMNSTVSACRSWGGSTHLHCAETSVEVEMNLEERGQRHVPWLDALGVLGPDLQLAHSVWLDDSELDLIAQSGAMVVHCPVSNMYLASGVARIREMLDLGITVALATDGPGSNNRQDMFEACKATVLLQKVNRLDATVLQPEEILSMACRGGASAMGRPDDLGSIQPGMKADLVVVNLETPFAGPVHRVPSALVYCASPRDVVHVMVDGRVLIHNQEMTTVNENAAIARATDVARRVFRRAGISTRIA
jgi:5-methylthioadenosine/S-adenosylhomocysteine deaminase|tara:strand:+ start:2185 stop:3552 length:1368 start_codon:yes stop_codon:yes gene_type:complete